MKLATIRLLLVVALLSPLLALVSSSPASASSSDDLGAWKWFPPSNNNETCLFTGTHIIVGADPDKHNVASANDCAEANSVFAYEYHLDSAGRIIDECFGNSGTDNNYSKCQIQASTLSGDYWEWFSEIEYGGNYNYQSCSNQNASYDTCYSSVD